MYHLFAIKLIAVCYAVVELRKDVENIEEIDTSLICDKYYDYDDEDEEDEE